MPASLIARSLTVSFGPRPVLDAVDLTLAPGDRVGIVGPNGVGKSTLFAALAGRVAPDAGSVTLAPPSATVGLLAQEPERSATESVRGYVRRRTGVAAAQRALDDAIEGLAAGVAGAEERYATALERWLSLGGDDVDARLARTADELGLPAGLLDRPTADLSGGEAARCALASLLVSRYDVVLLDEPTNDLDADGLERLERWVLGLRSPLAVISHDRAFLERTVVDVVEIDPFTRRATRFAGGWAAYVAERELARRHARERYEVYEAQRRALLDRAQREREWAAQGRARVRRTDEPDRNIRAFKMAQTEQLAGRAARTRRAVERLEVVDEPREPWELRLDIPDASRSGDVVVTCTRAEVARGAFRLGPIDLQLAVRDRVALTGANGSGKTTLIDLLVGRLAPRSGSVTLGSGVVVGEIEQARLGFLGTDPLVESFVALTGRTAVEVRTLLAKFGLGADDVLRPAATLSPGERTRASLALLMARGANLLVLDEPTNHLDLEAVEQLEQALDTFGGTIVLVTHDRRMLERVRLDRRLELVDGRLSER